MSAPSPVHITTARLVIREAVSGDVPALVAFVTENRKFLQPYEPTRADEYFTHAYWDQRVRDNRDAYERDAALKLCLFLKSPPETLVGTVSLNNIVRGAFQACHLGYALGDTYQGRGYMTEAVRAVIDFTFQEMRLHRIMANYLVDNERSAALLNRLGFVKEGRAEKYLKINGRWQDHILTSLIHEGR